MITIFIIAIGLISALYGIWYTLCRALDKAESQIDKQNETNNG